MTYSKNSNGFFFDFQNLDKNVVKDISDFIASLQTNLNNATDCDDTTPINDSVDNPKDTTDQSDKLSKTSLSEECLQTVLQLNVPEQVPIGSLMSTLERDRVVTKRTTSNRFTLAKKKYSKQVATDIKYTMSDILMCDA